MPRVMLVITMAATLAASGCAGRADRTTVAGPPGGAAPAGTPAVTPPPEWHGIATGEDRERLAGIHGRWRQALAASRHSGDDPLLDAAGALPHPALPPGPYQCRTIKFGEAGGANDPRFRAYRPFFCHVAAEGERLSFTKQTGSERPSGWLYADGILGYVFLGTQSGGEHGYGSDPADDLAGRVERVGPMRWRIVLPDRGLRARMTLIELAPVTAPLETPDR